MVLGDEEPEYGEGVDGCGIGRFWTFTSTLRSRVSGGCRLKRGGGRKAYVWEVLACSGSFSRIRVFWLMEQVSSWAVIEGIFEIAGKKPWVSCCISR